MTVTCRCFLFGFADCEVHRCGHGDRKSESGAGALSLSQYFFHFDTFHFLLCYFAVLLFLPRIKLGFFFFLIKYIICH